MDPRQRASNDAGSLLTLSLPLLPISASRLRRELQAHLLTNHVPARVRADVMSATEEAVINALVHSDAPSGSVEVSVLVLDGHVELTVGDDGHGFDPSAIDTDHAPDPLEAHGRGLFLVHALMDDVEIASGSAGTRIRMVRRIHRRP